MGRRRLARSFQYFGRCYLYNLSVPSSKPIVSGINGRFPSCSAGISSPSECVQPTLLPRVLRVSSVTERRPEFATSRRSMMSQGLETSTMVASIDHDDYSRRVARSHSSMISTSGRTRGWCYEQRCGHTSGQNFEGKEKISVVFFDKDGEETKIQVPVGMSMLEAAHENDIELEGACEGSLACSTCHVIVMDEDMYSRLPEPSDEENDMLDLAFGLTETSRLGCQVIAKPELDGLHLALPAATRNFAVDGHVPKPH